MTTFEVGNVILVVVCVAGLLFIALPFLVYLCITMGVFGFHRGKLLFDEHKKERQDGQKDEATP